MSFTKLQIGVLSLCGSVGGAALALLPGCATPTAAPPMAIIGEVVPAADALETEGYAVGARYWGELSPLEGRMHLFEVYPGNIIYRDTEDTEGLHYNEGGTATQGTCTPTGNCLPSSSQVKLYTDQTKVTYEDSSGICHQNGAANCAANPPSAPCTAANMYCAPLQIVSNYTFSGTVGALPNVIVQLANQTTATNLITGCEDNSAGDYGLCATTGSAKVDSTTSTLTSSILGAGTSNCSTTTCPCSYCYGNKNKVTTASLAGLQNAVMSGLNTTMAGYNTDTLAMMLSNTATTGITISVLYGIPSFNLPGSQITLKNGLTTVSCVTAGTTTASVVGGGFGPPASCFATTPPTSCPSTAATPLPTYQILFPKSGGGTVAATTNVLWKDTQVSATVPTGIVSGSITISTPISPGGVISTNDTFTVCSAPNSWRKMTTTLGPAIGAAAGVIGTNIVVAGGRTDATTTDSETTATTILPVPTTATQNPSTSSGPSLNTARWGAAYATVGGKLYVIGGANQLSCLGSTEILASVSGSWDNTTVPALPGGVTLCQAAATAVGTAIVVTGGTTTPYTNNQDGIGSNNQTAYVLDTTNNTWTTLTNSGNIDPVDRFNHAAASSSTLGIFLGGNDFISGGALSDTASASVSGTTPTFTSVSSMPVALALPAVADVSSKSKIYMYGGASGVGSNGTPADGDAPGTSVIYSLADNGSGSWTTLSPTGDTPAARNAHVFISASSSGTPKIYAIGGQNGGANVEEIDEYYP